MRKFLFSLIGFMLLFYGDFQRVICAQQLDRNVNGIVRGDAREENLQEDYYFRTPELLFQPRLCIPDSLSDVKLPVKIWIIVTLDSTGRPRSERIIKSSNILFNDVAKKYARQYRFKVDSTMLYNGHLDYTIPLIFKK